MALFKANKFPPPEEIKSQDAFSTLWEDEIFRNGFKAMRVNVSKINEQIMVGVGNYYYNFKKQEWLPSSGQINLPIEAWNGLMKFKTQIDDKIEEEVLWDSLTALTKGIYFIFIFIIF